MSFDQVGLTPELLRAVAQQGYTEPTPVQSEAIPHVLAGRDVLAGAQTGTGKTAAFVLPILQKLNASRREGRSPIRVLVLTPTRELALQVEESVRTYGKQRPVQSAVIYGGVGFEQQVRNLRQGPQIVVATPGRLLDHVGQRTIDLSRVEVLVLDEADRMLDMGFIHDIKKVIALLPVARQNLLFSATFSMEIRRLAAEFLKDPAYVQVTPKNTAPDLVKQIVMPVDKSRKRELLSQLVKSGRIYQALVFTRTKHGADRLVQQLVLDGISAVAIHGNKSQPQRVRALTDFKRNKVAILVATDIAARGLDIDALPHVVNYELPMVASDYVHRIGRTGRAGTDGDAISLVCVDENSMLGEIERLLGHRIEQEIIPGFTPDRTIRPQPIQNRGSRPAGQQSRPAAFRPAPRREWQPQRTDRPQGGSRPAQSGGRPAYGQSRPAYGQSRPAYGGPRPSQGSIGRPVSIPGERLTRG
ncbi:MAG: ATP-dependent helicase RhlE [Chloroflexota bacterium]|nr:ATP-dependent helicase RhlE [Chloroflexota bacterium]